MKVLVVHNRYRSASPSGENRVVDDEIALLEKAGIQVVPLRLESDSIRGVGGHLRAASGPVYSPTGVAEFRRALSNVRPTVVHLHNVYPLISPYVVRVAYAAGVPTVQTVHNYRHQCVNGLLLRDGAICTTCVGNLGSRALFHGCYRGSRLETAAMLAGKLVHRNTWRRIGKFIVLSPYMASLMATGLGVSEEQIALRPTWCSGPPEVTPPGRWVLFIGRLDAYKGVDLLLRSWQKSELSRRGWELHVAGDGELRSDVERVAGAREGIIYHGPVDSRQLAHLYENAAVVAVPSRLYEGFPRVIAEAWSFGRPVIAGKNSNLDTIVNERTGWTTSLDEAAWARRLASLPDQDVLQLGFQARREWESAHSPTVGLASLLGIYETVCGKE